MIHIGDIIHGVIAKSIPYMDSYLVWVREKEVFAQLPKWHALKEYKTGDEVFAAVAEVNGARLRLSQKIPQFTKNILNLYMQELFAEKKWQILRAVVCPPIGKILIACEANETYEEINAIFQKYKHKIQIYENIKLYIIQYQKDIHALIQESLRPAPINKIVSIQYFPEAREATIHIEPGYLGAFVGKKGVNLKTSARLSNIKMNILEYKKL